MLDYLELWRWVTLGLIVKNLQQLLLMAKESKYSKTP